MKICIYVSLLLLSANIAAFEAELQKEVLAGDWRAAERILRRAESACGQQDSDNKCVDNTAFSRAWMYSRRAGQSGRDRETYFQQARDAYLKVLQNNPGHLPTIDNLILVMEQLSDRTGLERLLRTLRGLEENQRYAEVALMIASLYRDAGDGEGAYAMYSRAYESEKSNRAVTGMVAAFELSPGQSIGERLLGIAQSENNLTLRRSICETIMRQRPSVNSELWESAAISWVAWLGRDRRLTATVIEQFIDLPRNPEFRELRSRLRDPQLGLDERDLRIGDMTLSEYRRDGWWNETRLRSWAFAIAAWSEGHNRLLGGDVKSANTVWLAALQFAPPTRFYRSGELEGRWAISLELLTDFARLQQLYKPQLDPDGETFSRIETVLFASKAEAYTVNDLEAIQRHHTLMGKMYAELGIFPQRSSSDYRNAEFQLENAIKTAKRRGEQTGVEDPQPNLAKLLADGYSCKLRGQQNNCTRDETKAERYYTEAARDFIKLDAVAPARQSIDLLKIYQPEPTDEVKQLETLIDLRASLTREQLQKGQNHPDVIMKQIDLATEWEVLGEDAKARESIDRAIVQSNSTDISREEIYQTLKRGDAEAVKKISREKLLVVPSN